MLCIRDSETVKKWCKERDVSYHQIGNSREMFILHDDLVRLIELGKRHKIFMGEVYPKLNV